MKEAVPKQATFVASDVTSGCSEPSDPQCECQGCHSIQAKAARRNLLGLDLSYLAQVRGVVVGYDYIRIHICLTFCRNRREFNTAGCGSMRQVNRVVDFL